MGKNYRPASLSNLCFQVSLAFSGASPVISINSRPAVTFFSEAHYFQPRELRSITPLPISLNGESIDNLYFLVTQGGKAMSLRTEQLAEKLIRASLLDSHSYLEMKHLDPPLFVAVYVRTVFLRTSLRRFVQKIFRRNENKTFAHM